MNRARPPRPPTVRRTDGYLLRTPARVDPGVVERNVLNMIDDKSHIHPFTRAGKDRFVTKKEDFVQTWNSRAIQIESLVDSSKVYGYLDEDNRTRLYGTDRKTKHEIDAIGKNMDGRFSRMHRIFKFPQLTAELRKLQADLRRVLATPTIDRALLRACCERGESLLAEFCNQDDLLNMENYSQRNVSLRRFFQSDEDYLNANRGGICGQQNGAPLCVWTKESGTTDLLLPSYLSIKKYQLKDEQFWAENAQKEFDKANNVIGSRERMTSENENELRVAGYTDKRRPSRNECNNCKGNADHLFRTTEDHICTARCICGSFHYEAEFCDERDRDDYAINDALMGTRSAIADCDSLSYPYFPVSILDAETGSGKSTKCIMNLAKMFPNLSILVCTTRRDAAKNGYEYVKSSCNISAHLSRSYIQAFQLVERNYFELKSAFKDMKLQDSQILKSIRQEASRTGRAESKSRSLYPGVIAHLIDHAVGFLKIEKSLELLQYTVAYTVGQRDFDSCYSPNYDSSHVLNQILYTTDGWLINHPNTLDKFDIIVLDEAHDLTSEKEILFAIVRKRVMADRQRWTLTRQDRFVSDVLLDQTRRLATVDKSDKKTRAHICSEVANKLGSFRQLPLHVIVASATLMGPKESDVELLRDSTEFVNSSILSKIAVFFDSVDIPVVRTALAALPYGTASKKNDSFVVFSQEADLLHCPVDASRQQLYQSIECALLTIKHLDFGLFSFKHLQGTGVLVFVHTKEDCVVIAQELRERHKILAVPYYSGMDPGWKRFIYRNSSGMYRRGRVIIATNVAESALTIPDLGFVIDSGLVIRKWFDYESNCETIFTERCSHSERLQRIGRIGRTGDGVAILLYSKREADECRVDVKTEVMTSDIRNLLPLLSRKLTINSEETRILGTDLMYEWGPHRSPIPTIIHRTSIELIRSDIFGALGLGEPMRLDGNTTANVGTAVRKFQLIARAHKYLCEGIKADIVPLCNMLDSLIVADVSDSEYEMKQRERLISVPRQLYLLARAIATSTTLFKKTTTESHSVDARRHLDMNSAGVKEVYAARNRLMGRDNDAPEPSPFGDLGLGMRTIEAFYRAFVDRMRSPDFLVNNDPIVTNFFTENHINRCEMTRVLRDWERQHHIKFSEVAHLIFGHSDADNQQYRIYKYSISELRLMRLDEAVCRVAQQYYHRYLMARAIHKDELGSNFNIRYRGIGMKHCLDEHDVEVITKDAAKVLPSSPLTIRTRPSSDKLKVLCLYDQLTFEHVIELSGETHIVLAMEAPRVPFSDWSFLCLTGWPCNFRPIEAPMEPDVEEDSDVESD